jgi:hypothetical protein
MIQWIENTRPLKEIIEEEIAKEENKRPGDSVSILKLPAAIMQDEWLKSFAKKIVGNSMHRIICRMVILSI